MNGTDSGELQSVYRAFLISQFVILGLVACVLPLELWGFVEYWKTAAKRRDVIMRRLRWSLVLNGWLVAVIQIPLFLFAVLTGLSLYECQVLAKVTG